MLRTAMLALGASLTIGAIAPYDASAQLTGRARSQGATTPRADRPGTVVHQDPRINDGRYDRNGCYDDDGRNYDRGRYDHEKDKRKDKYKNKDGRYENRGRYDRDDDDRYDRDDRGRGNRDDDCYNSSSRGNGPAFCRSGQGHPVYGMAWCRDKSWGNASFRNTGWQDVILRRPRDAAQRDLSRSVLEDILGRAVYGRFDQQRMRLGSGSPLFGRWLDTSNGSILNLFAGGVQVAQIFDGNRDGRADVVLLNYGSYGSSGGYGSNR